MLPDVKDEFAASLVANKVKLTEDDKKSLNVLKRQVYGNMCVVYLKQEKWDRV